jgi:hypothetical protein
MIRDSCCHLGVSAKAAPVGDKYKPPLLRLADGILQILIRF